MALTQGQVLSRFRRKKPKNADEAMRFCRVSLRFIAEGAFRRVYQIEDLPLIAKFPYFADDHKTKEYEQRELESNIAHSKVEWNALRRILKSKKKYAKLQPLMPKVYHFNPKTGVVVMHKYETPKASARFKRICAQLEDTVREAVPNAPWAGSYSLDIDNYDNVGKDEKGNYVLLDLGCFDHSEEDDWW